MIFNLQHASPEGYGSHSLCMCVCVSVRYHISSVIAYLYATTMIWISFDRYVLEYYKRGFSQKSFVR